MSVPAAPRATRPIAAFLLLTAALSLPFWALAAWAQAEPLPGLPLSGLMAFMPALAAVILVGRRQGWAGVRAFLGRSFDAGRITPPILIDMLERDNSQALSLVKDAEGTGPKEFG